MLSSFGHRHYQLEQTRRVPLRHCSPPPPQKKEEKKTPKALTAKHNQQRKGREHVENHSGTLSAFLPSSILSSTACYTTTTPLHPPVFLYTLCTLSPLFFVSLSNVHFFCLDHSFLFHGTLSFCVTRSALIRSLWPPLSKPPISSSFPQFPSFMAGRERKKSTTYTHTHTHTHGVKCTHTHTHTVTLCVQILPTPPKTSFNAHSPPHAPTNHHHQPPPPSTLSNPPSALILITPPPPSSALISLHQICCDSKQFPLICNFLLPAPASYTSIKPPTPSNKPSPPPQYPGATHQAQTPPWTPHAHKHKRVYKCTHVHTLWPVAIKEWRLIMCKRWLATVIQWSPRRTAVWRHGGRRPRWLVEHIYVWVCVIQWACGWDGGTGGIQFGGWVDPVGLAASLNQENEWEPTLGVTPFLPRWPLLISLFSFLIISSAAGPRGTENSWNGRN